MELTRSELEIMDVIWDAERPLSRADLLERSKEKCWKDSSIHILLNGLLQKEAIYEAGFVKCSKTYGRTFGPALTREQYYARTVFSHRRKPDVVGLVDAIVSRGEITESEMKQIKDLVAAK